MKIDPQKFQERIDAIIEYNQVRGWNQAPEDLAKSIVLEAAELLEHYQWDASARRLKTKKKAKNQTEIEYEVADIIWYLVLFCQKAKIDPVEALDKKMKYNEEKYPVHMFAGKHNEDFYKSQKQKYRVAKKK